MPEATLAIPTLPPLATQADRLVALGVHELAGMPAAELRGYVADEFPSAAGDLLVVSESLVPASVLAPLLRLGEREGFVVEDMTDVDAFAPVDVVDLPNGPAFVASGVDRGDEMANWSPDEALPSIVGAGRSPLTLTEGIHWALQAPEVLERNHCFMTIGIGLAPRVEIRTSRSTHG